MAEVPRRVLVYAGKGSSHSWTWLADLFESRGLFDVRFLGSKEFTESLGDPGQIVVISGGDGFSIASAICPHGFAHLKGFIHRGGRYVGICAGAYLPLPSSLEPFSRFNLSRTKIDNIDLSPLSEEPVSPRVAVRYGSCSIVHPVRGEVELDLVGKSVLAPLYGGPVFREPTEDAVLLRYKGLTGKSEVQIDREQALSMLAGKPAVIEAMHGSGELLLLGPHLEHPGYGRANDLFIDLLSLRRGHEGERAAPTRMSSPEHGGISSSLADLKVAILGLENRSFLVGSKLWDGSRFLELLSALERRKHTLGPDASAVVTRALERARDIILSGDGDLTSEAGELSSSVVEAARACVDNHFSVMRGSR